jgi:hypothetical protein
MLTLMGHADEAMRALAATAQEARYDGELPDGSGTVEESLTLIRATFPWSDVGAMLVAARSAYETESRRTSVWQPLAALNLGWALLLAGESDEAVAPSRTRPHSHRARSRGSSPATHAVRWPNPSGRRRPRTGRVVDRRGARAGARTRLRGSPSRREEGDIHGGYIPGASSDTLMTVPAKSFFGRCSSAPGSRRRRRRLGARTRRRRLSLRSRPRTARAPWPACCCCPR